MAIINSTLSQAQASAGLSAWDPRLAESLKTKSTGPTSAIKDPKELAKLKRACQEMEGVFMNMLLKSMRNTVPKNKDTGGGFQIETMQSFFDMEMTRNLATSTGGGMGLADMIYKNLTEPGVTRVPQPINSGK